MFFTAPLQLVCRSIDLLNDFHGSQVLGLKHKQTPFVVTSKEVMKVNPHPNK